MNGIDTNILVRYLTADDQKQYQQVLNLLQSESGVYINPIVWVETVWVLTHFYNINIERQCEELAKLLEIDTFVVDNRTVVLKALNAYQKGYDFADAMIGLNNALHCKTTWTFDKKAARMSEFTRN
ncbi:PIN domain-containing protein [Endozoicomonas acroporae]|uniref:PIN domain-containing protein n=1 Tax=Endozoicomonas acroporae TaxID=1701104 RepID=UPI003D7A923D